MTIHRPLPSLATDDDEVDADVATAPRGVFEKLGITPIRGAATKIPKRPMHIAVVGATGVVGREVVSLLEERRFPIASLRLYASEKSKGESVAFRDREEHVGVLSDGSFRGIDIAFFAAGSDVAKKWAPVAAAAGAVVIDKSSAFRKDPEVPLVIPEVNGAALSGYERKRIIATPNCSTIQMLQCLAPLHRAVGVKRVVVCTYQAVSGAGKGGVVELEEQVRDMFNLKEPKVEVFDQRIAFNVLPRIPALDPMHDDGSTGEEQKMIEETHRILDNTIGVAATCVRVPVFNGHSEALHIELLSPLTAQQASDLLAKEPNVLVVDDRQKGLYPTAQDASGEDKTLVGRIRTDASVPGGCGLSLWVVSDNLRTGAALNAVRIAEALCADHLP